jgi:hypothetical protein
VLPACLIEWLPVCLIEWLPACLIEVLPAYIKDKKCVFTFRVNPGLECKQYVSVELLVSEQTGGDE